MAGVSKNSFDLIKNAMAKLKGKMTKAFVATLIMIAPLMLCCFTVYGIAAACMLWAVFQVGYIRYMRALLNDENPSYALIFSEFDEPWLEIFLGAILVSMYLLGLVLFVVPGIILIGLFGMTVFFAEYKKAKTPVEAMKHSAKYTRGNVMNMFAFKVLFWAAYLLILIIGMIGVLGIIKLWANYKAVAIILLVVLYVAVTLAWSVVTVYHHATAELFFRELLVYNNDKTEETVEEKQTEVVEEKPVEIVEKVEVEKPAPKKTTAAKRTTAKATTTKTSTAKAATAKAPAKKTTTSKTTTKSTGTSAAKKTTK